MLIGIDFDNTIITYDAVFVAAARERGLISEDFSAGKQAVRDFIRTLPYSTAPMPFYGAASARDARR